MAIKRFLNLKFNLLDAIRSKDKKQDKEQNKDLYCPICKINIGKKVGIHYIVNKKKYLKFQCCPICKNKIEECINN